MSTELTTQNNNLPAFSFFNADNFEAIQRVAKMFTHSELVPKMYRTSPDNPEAKALANCVIALSMSTRIGADPLMIMQNMYIVHGQPAWSAKFLTATVNACGKFKSMKYKMREIGSCKGVEYTETKYVSGQKKTETKKVLTDIPNIECIAYTSEHGSDEILESIPVTVEMAIKEGWYFKDGSKWQTMPKLMLQYRTVTFWTRAYAPELSMGLKSEDEVIDTIEDIPYTDVTDKVTTEINEKGNKKAIDIEEEPKVEEVKTEEVKEEKKAETSTKTEDKQKEETKSEPITQATASEANTDGSPKRLF